MERVRNGLLITIPSEEKFELSIIKPPRDIVITDVVYGYFPPTSISENDTIFNVALVEFGKYIATSAGLIANSIRG